MLLVCIHFVLACFFSFLQELQGYIGRESVAVLLFGGGVPSMVAVACHVHGAFLLVHVWVCVA